MVEIIWLLLILAMPLWAFLCAYFASSQGRYVAGWAVAGLFLNVWAVILVAVLQSRSGSGMSPPDGD